MIGSAALLACSDSIAPLNTAEPGVVFTYPVDGQLDVPLGTRIVVTFSDPVVASALGSCSGQGDATSGAFCLVGPGGALDVMGEVVGDGKSVQFDAPPLDAGTQYSLYVRSALAPSAKNLPGAGPLVTFTTRSAKPLSAAPALVAVNGGDAAHPDSFRPMFESSTIRLVFSEPLDPRTIELRPGSVELVEHATGKAVPATVLAKDIHVSIDPKDDLTAGTAYDVRLGGNIIDLGGTPLPATSFTVTPQNSRGSGAIPQVLRTRQPNDPGPKASRSGADRNVIVIDKPLIGRQESSMNPGAVKTELGDPKALGGPIAFTIRKGQRLSSSELAIKLGGEIPVGLSTGDIEIEFLTDAGGRLYRNPHQPADQRPENERAPLYVDLSFDVAVYAQDPMGNAVLTQTILGVQATGTAVATDGVLSIETVGSMEIGLLGVAQAPANLVLELITDASAAAPTDTEPPTLVASYPADGATDHPVGAGIDLIFSEPVDIDRMRGGVQLLDANNQPVPFTLESQGSAIVVRPLGRLAYSTQYHVALGDIADIAGNAMGATGPMTFSTERLVGTGVPMTLSALHPGAPCALEGATGGSPGRCTGGKSSDDLYQPFSLAANEPIEADFSQPINRASATLGACGSGGSVRVEAVGGGTCAPVAGTLVTRDRSVAFFPDQPWEVGKQYRLSLVSGGNNGCDANELCGASGDAASFDPLNGTTSGDAGGPTVAINFVGAPASKTTFMVAEAGPFTDINGSGFVDSGEATRDNNRAALRITGTTGAVGSASFQMADCIPSTPETEGCMYLSGAMPVEMGELQMNCTLPGGMTAPACLPVTLSPQAMYATSVTIKASVGISITSDTGTNIMRIRQPAAGDITGYIIDRNGTPTMVAALDLYLDAPDMSIPLSSHDLHSKPMSVMFDGPVRFMPDGRIAIDLTNVADIPVSVKINATLLSGTVDMIVPHDELKLQLLSRPLRGVER